MRNAFEHGKMAEVTPAAEAPPTSGGPLCCWLCAADLERPAALCDWTERPALDAEASKLVDAAMASVRAFHPHSNPDRDRDPDGSAEGCCQEPAAKRVRPRSERTEPSRPLTSLASMHAAVAISALVRDVSPAARAARRALLRKLPVPSVLAVALSGGWADLRWAVTRLADALQRDGVAWAHDGGADTLFALGRWGAVAVAAAAPDGPSVSALARDARLPDRWLRQVAAVSLALGLPLFAELTTERPDLGKSEPAWFPFDLVGDGVLRAAAAAAAEEGEDDDWAFASLDPAPLRLHAALKLEGKGEDAVAAAAANLVQAARLCGRSAAVEWAERVRKRRVRRSGPFPAVGDKRKRDP